MSKVGHNNPPADQGGGWVAIRRAMREHWLVGFGQPVKPCDPERGAYSRAEAFIDLIMECRYEAGTVNNNGRKMRIQPGQLLGAVSWLAARWNWTPKTVRGFLDKLEDDGMIERAEGETRPGPEHSSGEIKPGNQKGRFANIINICNYALYQIVDRPQGQVPGPVQGQLRAGSGPVEGNIYKDNKGTREQGNNSMPPTPQWGDDRIKLENGQLKLFNGLKQFWLEKFGSEEMLDLALIEAAGSVQPNNLKPLEAQVGRILARKVADKRDKDARYAKAVRANAKEAPASESRVDRWARKLKEIEASEGGAK